MMNTIQGISRHQMQITGIDDFIIAIPQSLGLENFGIDIFIQIVVRRPD